MQLRTAHDLRFLVQDARRRSGWSQTQLADAVGVSRQWISLVENGKTSVEFDLVLSSLQSLGYSVYVEMEGDRRSSVTQEQGSERFLRSGPSDRTPLTRKGNPLGHQRSRRNRNDRNNE